MTLELFQDGKSIMQFYDGSTFIGFSPANGEQIRFSSMADGFNYSFADRRGTQPMHLSTGGIQLADRLVARATSRKPDLTQAEES